MKPQSEKNLRYSLCCALAGVLVLLTSGCASYNRIAEYPTPTKPATVAIVAKPMSKMSELPIGAYYDEQRQIIVTGHQKGLFTGLMFGMVGVIVADQMNKSSAAAKYGDDSARSTSDLLAVAHELIGAAQAEGRTTHWTVTTGNASLRLSPYAVFTVEKEGGARLYAMLRAEILGADGTPTWSARYFARAPGTHPLDGAETWMTGTHFADGMRIALSRALNVCIDDTQGKLTGKNHQLAKGRYPYINTDIELPTILVQENPDYVVARLALGDALVLAGTHVLNREDYAFKAGTFKDPRAK